MQEKRNMADVLARRAELKAEVEKFGQLRIENAQRAFELLEEYNNLDSRLQDARNQQFYNDAWDIAKDMKAATGKNVDMLAAFLRRFAEHVAQFALVQPGNQSKNVPELVDRIPSLVQEEEDELDEEYT